MNSNHHPPETDDFPDSYLTIGEAGEAELKVQRSRFVALACPVESDDAARARLEEFRRRFHDARHACFGYRLGLGRDSITRKNDDGEPSGTAGDPIVKAIDRCALTDVLVVVVRYFGGVKLGTGGLARAYGQAAEMALDQASRREVLLGREFMVQFPYAQEKTIRRLLESGAGKILDQDYGADVTWRIWLPHSRWRGFADSLTESTAGAVELGKPENTAD